MNFLNGITVLLIYQLIGEVLVRTLSFPIPGPVVGMFLLFLSLLLRRSLPDSLDDASTGLLSHLSLLFVPAGVGVIVHLDSLRDEWLAIGLALVASTFLTMAGTAFLMVVATRFLARQNDAS